VWVSGYPRNRPGSRRHTERILHRLRQRGVLDNPVVDGRLQPSVCGPPGRPTEVPVSYLQRPRLFGPQIRRGRTSRRHRRVNNMSTRTYGTSYADCKCSGILDLVNSFLPEPITKPIVFDGSWCSLFCSLMKDFDNRFVKNNGQWNKECICPVCGQPLCDWCEQEIPYGAREPTRREALIEGKA